MNDNAQVKLTALSIAELAGLLKRAGGRYVSEDAIRQDIATGAPVNTDGTMNLIAYAAWLIKEMNDGD